MDPENRNSATTQDLKGTATDQLLVARYRLDVTGGPGAGMSVESEGERMILGTHPSADLVLIDPAVSRLHCELVLAHGRVHIRDLGSRNGTFVDGVQITRAPLRSSAELKLGRTKIRLRLIDKPATIALHPEPRFGRLVGRSANMRALFGVLERDARRDATEHLHGETGTGKELAAEAIHEASERRNGPFVVVDCGALPHNLIESELFGHERGAFTGADKSRAGAFEQASTGTLLLDEIGELAPELHTTLLRVLERRTVKRVGSDRYDRVDVRIVAATHQDLRARVNTGEFRSDLYYRLAVVQARLPALRERREDIPLLALQILEDLGARSRPELAWLIEPKFLDELARHDWPGNVRELKNYLESCVWMEQAAPMMEPIHETSDAELGVDRPLREARDRWIAGFERAYLEALLRRHGGNVTASARHAGVDRAHLHRLIRRHRIKDTT